MKKFIIVVDFQLKPGTLEQFMPLMLDNAAASKRDEPGCQQFDVLTPYDKTMLNECFYLLSDKTAEFDKNRKRFIYEKQLRVPEYYWYDPFNAEDFAGFKLADGAYQPLPVDEQGHIYSSLMDLKLVRWRGVYQGVETTWLRWASAAGELLPTAAEAAQQRATDAEAEVARLRAILEKQSAQ